MVAWACSLGSLGLTGTAGQAYPEAESHVTVREEAFGQNLQPASVSSQKRGQILHVDIVTSTLNSSGELRSLCKWTCGPAWDSSRSQPCSQTDTRRTDQGVWTEGLEI